MTDDQIAWFRLNRSGLVKPFESMEDTARDLVGIQAQMPVAAGLALWNRVAGLTQADVLDAQLRKRSLVRLWGQRGTVHLYASTDWPLVIGALGAKPTWWFRRIRQAGRDLAAYEALIDRLSDQLLAAESIGRRDLRGPEWALDDDLLSSWGGVFAELVRRGVACHIGAIDGQGRFAHRERWLPDLEWNPPDADPANVEIGRRYLAAYGPARLQDVAAWRGSAMAETRRWMAALAPDLTEVGAEDHLVRSIDLDELLRTPPPRDEWPVHLLHRFDPLLLAHKDRSWVVAPAHRNQVWRPAGHIEPVVLVCGRAAGTWRYERSGRALRVTLHPFQSLSRRVMAQLAPLADAVARHLGLERAELALPD